MVREQSGRPAGGKRSWGYTVVSWGLLEPAVSVTKSGRHFFLRGRLAIIFSGSPKPEACWSGRSSGNYVRSSYSQWSLGMAWQGHESRCFRSWANSDIAHCFRQKKLSNQGNSLTMPVWRQCLLKEQNDCNLLKPLLGISMCPIIHTGTDAWI